MAELPGATSGPESAAALSPSSPAAAMSLSVTDSSAPPSASSGSPLSVSRPGQEGAGLVHGETDGAGQVQVLGDEDVVIVPLDVQQIVGVAFGQARADQDPQVVLELLAGDPEPGGHLADVQSLVVDKERDQLQHPLELVL